MKLLFKKLYLNLSEEANMNKQNFLYDITINTDSKLKKVYMLLEIENISSKDFLIDGSVLMLNGLEKTIEITGPSYVYCEPSYHMSIII